MSGKDRSSDTAELSVEPPDGAWQRYRIDPDERPSTAVAVAIAAVTGTEATGMAPLHDTVDPDALDALFRHGRGRHVRLELIHHGCEVAVDAEEIRVRERP